MTGSCQHGDGSAAVTRDYGIAPDAGVDGQQRPIGPSPIEDSAS